MTRNVSHSWKNSVGDTHKPTVAILDNDHVLITSDADTDADGSPDAKTIDPDSGQLGTALGKDNGWKGEGNYVNAREIPYYVLPGNWKNVTEVNCKLGDIAKLSYKDKSVYAIYADVGPTKIIGEASIAAVEALGHNPWKDGKIVSGISHGVTYEIIPGSSKLSQTLNFGTIQVYGKTLFNEVSELPVTWFELNRADDETPTITAYAGSAPKYTRHYKTKESLIEFLRAFPNAHTALVADKKDIPDVSDFTGVVPPIEQNSVAINVQESVTWLEFNRAADGTPAITAYEGSTPKYTRHYKTKESLIEFLLAFPNAHTTPVANDKDIIDCPDLIPIIPPNSTSAEKFVNFFRNHYADVRKEVERWFIDDIPQRWSPNAIKNGCVAHQVSCLHLCGLPHPDLDTIPSVNVDAFVAWALNHNWQKVTSMNSLKPGDVCVSASDGTDLDHVYCFVDYIDTNKAHVFHNQVFGLAVRSLTGDSNAGPWQFALRMP